MTSIGRPDAGVLCPVNLTDVSGQPVFHWIEEPMALFVLALYLRPMAGSGSLSWPFALTYQPCELSQSPPTHLHH